MSAKQLSFMTSLLKDKVAVYQARLVEVMFPLIYNSAQNKILNH